MGRGRGGEELALISGLTSTLGTLRDINLNLDKATKENVMSRGRAERSIERTKPTFPCSLPKSAAQRNVRTAGQRPDQYETTRSWIEHCRSREWEAVEVPMMVDKGSTLSSMEKGALLLVVRRKGVKLEATPLHSLSEGAIPSKREVV